MHTVALLLDTGIDRASRLLFVCGGVILLLILGLTLTDIALRAIGYPLRGVVEISGYLGAAGIGLCLPRAQRAGSHLETGMLNDRMPEIARVVLRCVITLLCIGFMLLLAWEAVDLGLFVRDGAERIDGWNFSYDTMIFALALGCAGQAVVQINDLVQLGVHRLSVRTQQQAKSEKAHDHVVQIEQQEKMDQATPHDLLAATPCAGNGGGQ